MRAVILFFLVFCFNLLGGNASIHAGSPFTKAGYQCGAPSIQKASKFDLTKYPQNFVIARTGLVEEYTYPIALDDEDEEESFKKQLIQAKYLLAFFHAFISSFSCTSITTRLPFDRHLSYINSCTYISQRVLRI
jgi:hypothetical protein